MNRTGSESQTIHPISSSSRDSEKKKRTNDKRPQLGLKFPPSFNQFQEERIVRRDRTFNFIRRLYFLNLIAIFVSTYILTFHLFYRFYQPNIYVPPLHHIAWILPFPYTLSAVIGLFLKYDDPADKRAKIRYFNHLYIVVVTKGSNRDAVYRGWNSLRDLRDPERGIHLFVLTDAPHYFPDISCITVPHSFQTTHAKYKARALEYFRLTMRLGADDWVLHLDEESTIDHGSLEACINFIERTKYHFGQGIILYNQHEYWKRPLITVADAIRVGDDIGRFHFQYKTIHQPIFGAHGSFLLTNGALENDITWEISGMTEDFEFALRSWMKGYKCGEILGVVREQSPQSVVDFLKQRRRWFVGIRTVKHPIARYLIFQWICGVVCAMVTVLNVLLQPLRTQKSPLWIGILGNFSFVVFSYMYLLGTLIQDYDIGSSPKIILINLLRTFLLHPFCSVLESASVLYGLLTTPTDFEVIRK